MGLKGSASGAGAGLGGEGVGVEDRQVAHFAPGFGRGFAVEVDGNGRVGSEGSIPAGGVREPEVAEEVGHGGGSPEVGRAEREAAEGPDLLGELGGFGGLDGEVAGVVGSRG